MDAAPAPPVSITAAGRVVYYPCAEGLRAVAAGMVFLHHVGFYTGATYNSRIGDVLARLDVGVPVFFALSGFLLFLPYMSAILDDLPLPDTRSFYVRRALRIYPAYWVALTAVFLVLRPDASRLAGVTDYPMHYLLLQIYPDDAAFEGISQAWSLAVEVSFYLLLPWLALGVARLVARRPVSQRALLVLAVTAGLYLFSLAWRAVVYRADLPDRLSFWLPGMLDYFAIGIALAALVAWGERRGVARPLLDALGRRDLLWYLAAGATLVFVSNQLELAKGLERAAWHNELLRQLCYEIIALCLLVPAVFGSPDRGIVRRTLRSRPLVLLGLVSYSFYLWHVAFIEAFMDWTDRPMFLDWTDLHLYSPDVLATLVGSFVLTLAASVLTYRFVERPAIAWSRRITRRR